MTTLAAGASTSITLQAGSAVNLSGTGLAVVNNVLNNINNRGVVGPYPANVVVYLTATTAMDYASFTPNTRTASAQYGGPRSQAQIDAMNAAYTAGKIDIPTSFSVFNTDTNSTWRFNGTVMVDGGGSSGILPPALRNIAGRCRNPSGKSTTSEVYFNARSNHPMFDDHTTVLVVYPNYAKLSSSTSPAANGESGAGGTTLFTGSLTGPNGVRKPIVFSGVAADSSVIIGTCTLDAGKRGDVLTHRAWGFTQGTGICYTQVNSLATAATYGDALALSTTVLTDLTMTGDVVNTATGGKFFYPLAIIALTTQPSIGIWGDSRGAGASDTQDAAGLVGHMERAIGTKYPFINLSTQGERAFYAQTNCPITMSMAAYLSHMACADFINDVNAGTSAVNLMIQKAAIRAGLVAVNPTIRNYECTCFPSTTSSDSFLLTANQTVSAGNGPRITANTTIRTTQLANCKGFIEISDAVEPYRDAGIIRLSGDLGAPAGYDTSDGLHLKQPSEKRVALQASILSAMGL